VIFSALWINSLGFRVAFSFSVFVVSRFRGL
jgi:hypothetical protein